MKRYLLALIVCLSVIVGSLCAQQGKQQQVLISHKIAAGGGAGFVHIVSHAQGFGSANGGTTSAIDTTGADFIAVVVAWGVGSNITVTDSKSNTWTELTGRGVSTDTAVQIIYANNATVGTGHTFTVTGTNVYPAIGVRAFSGGHTTAPFDVENGATGGSGPTLSTGSITPSQNDELVIAGVATLGTSHTVDSGFTGSNVNSGGSDTGLGSAYKIQTTAAAVNPQFSWTGGIISSAAAIASFKKQ